jgi:hypothetical protein
MARLGMSIVAMRVPSGDQGVPYQAAPLVSWRLSWPLGFITQMSPQLGLTMSAMPCVSATYAIFESSGLQSGTWSETRSVRSPPTSTG